MPTSPSDAVSSAAPGAVDRTAADGAPDVERPTTWRRRLFTVLLVWMVVSFTVGAITKFYPGETFFGAPYSVKFVEWGYPSWFRFVVGGGELVAAAMLISPRSRFLGALLLVVITAGAVVTHWVNGDPVGESASAHVHLVLSLLVAWVARPRRAGA
ncbi:DoxX family protein [Beutenbergia cavernae DSM 12333]|uniref:DoxX family protein n=1 Tax=Beutenbergia cavernae (strain ATCC BAA-8 / DSM 12333 / CCUG 43141 / JCM 11478 / NBRC 16432 / NCIMB 13614 / HKI 0122) TaxID=471853 RepID=C5C5Y3_BEUC1|nr:DoxX family protein [Beutenbergia cavernae]ACQ82341.1 DoxX family protein [Beutenbergia cavernae DSM 12333]